MSPTVVKVLVLDVIWQEPEHVLMQTNGLVKNLFLTSRQSIHLLCPLQRSNSQ